MSIFTNTFNQTRSHSLSYSKGLRNYMLGVYNYMSFGLFISAFLSFFAWKTAFVNVIIGTPLGILIALAPLGIVFYLGSRIHLLKVETAKILFIAYASLIGLSLSTIFLAFGLDLILRSFLITSVMFLSMNIYGYSTDKDLSSIGSYAFMMIFGLMISSLLNIFIKSSIMSNIISMISVIVFTGITAYDVQEIKKIYNNSSSLDPSSISKIAIIGALRLYMDFISIFIHLLHLMSALKNER